VPSRHDPAASLADILENLERIEGYVTGLDRDAYDRIDLHVLWNTVRDRLPSLKADVERALVGLKATGDRGDFKK
jgi:uncharacterized protein with HEPN domain